MLNFDTISIACAAREMEQAVVGARVERISQPSAHATQWTLFVRGEKHTLWIETDAASSRMHLTRRGRQSPPNPPAFCMLLRKLVGGAWLEGIDRPQGIGERIVCLHFASPESGRRYRLMVELMGRHGNQILIDETDAILGSVKRVTPQMSRFREIRAGLSYSLPPRQAGAKRNLFAPGAGNDLPEQSFATPAEAERWAAATFSGASPLMIREGLARIPHPERDIKPGAAGELNSESIWFGLSNLLNYVRLSDYSPVLLTDNLGRITGAYPIILRTLPGVQQPMAVSFSQAVDEAADALEQRSSFEGEKASLVSALVRARRIFESELLDIDEGLANADRAAEYQLAGELINSNLQKIRPGDEQAVLLDYVSGDDIEIELDPSLSAHDNAARYFAKYKKAKASEARLLERQEKVQGGAARIEDALPRAEAAASLDAVQALVAQLEDIQEIFNRKLAPETGSEKGRQPESPYAGHKIRTYRSVDGWEILVGETAESNDYLTTKVAAPSDIWLHARAQVSAHAVIRSQNRPAAVSPAAIRYAAEQVAKRSTSKHSRLVPVDYTLKKYVRKPRGSKPGSVMYSREKTIDVAPDAVASTQRDAQARL